ncbi:MAG: helix-turn-helix domain-containing protein [Bacteroidales bacterium]|nr:helix-turn-helix domain-containing protein [Bacteroidales bacterium]
MVIAPEERRTIQSVERALDILEVLATGTDEMRLNEIARAAHLNISTCHHLIATLLDRGYVGQNPRGRTYFLGNKTLELSRSRAAMIDLVKTAMPTLRALNQSTGETVSLDVLRGADLVTLAMLESRHAVRVALDEAPRPRRRTPPAAASRSWPGCRRPSSAASSRRRGCAASPSTPSAPRTS